MRRRRPRAQAHLKRGEDGTLAAPVLPRDVVDARAEVDFQVFVAHEVLHVHRLDDAALGLRRRLRQPRR